MSQTFSIPPDLIRGPECDILPLAGEVNWGMAKFDVERLRVAAGSAKLEVGVVDTGCDVSHPLLAGRVVARDFTGSAYGAADRNGHGTHCTGTVGASDPRIGVFQGAQLYHGKGLSDSGSGGMGELLAAMEWCFANGCTVVSCSWGGGTSVDPGTDRQLREWAERGLWCVFAAGNSGGNTSQTDAPGNSPHVINVAAIDSNYAPASFTSAGAKIDTSGPGVGIISLRPGGGFATMSGTSMATPFAAGMLGLYRAALTARRLPVPSVYDLRKLLQSDSVDTHTPGVDRRTGPGWISALLLSLNLTDLPRVG